jgi:hypothetical protein
VPFEDIVAEATLYEYENVPANIVHRYVWMCICLYVYTCARVMRGAIILLMYKNYRPYWQLRIVRATVISGGYLTRSVYIPKIVWTQFGAKFTGLGSKIWAFEQCVVLLVERICTLTKPISPEDTTTEELDTALTAFASVYDDFANIQNQLSKPFPFIKEASAPVHICVYTHARERCLFHDSRSAAG